MGPKKINKEKVTSTPTKSQNNLEKNAGPSAERSRAPSVRNHEEEQDSTLLLDHPRPRPRTVLRHRYKRQKMYYSVTAVHDDAREAHGHEEPKPGPRASGIPFMKAKLGGLGPASEVSVLEPSRKGVFNPIRAVLSVEGIVEKRQRPDGTYLDNVLVSGINPNNVTDNWSHRKNNPMTLDERIWGDNEIKRKEREAKVMERKRGTECQGVKKGQK